MVRRITWAKLENQKNGLTKIVLFTESNAEQNCVDIGRCDVQRTEKTMLNQEVHTENCWLRKNKLPTEKKTNF